MLRGLVGDNIFSERASFASEISPEVVQRGMEMRETGLALRETRRQAAQAVDAELRSAWTRWRRITLMQA